MKDRAHDVDVLEVVGNTMVIRVDGDEFRIDLSRHSQRLAEATPEQRQNFIVTKAGYGIHWPDVDEDLSIDGLVGIRHISGRREIAAFSSDRLDPG